MIRGGKGGRGGAGELRGREEGGRGVEGGEVRHLILALKGCSKVKISAKRVCVGDRCRHIYTYMKEREREKENSSMKHFVNKYLVLRPVVLQGVPNFYES